MAIQKAEQILKDIDRIARDFDSYEYGLPIRVDISEDEYRGAFDSMISVIQADRKAVIEECKKAWINRAELLFIKSDSATRENARAIAANEANNLFDPLLRELD